MENISLPYELLNIYKYEERKKVVRIINNHLKVDQNVSVLRIIKEERRKILRDNPYISNNEFFISDSDSESPRESEDETGSSSESENESGSSSESENENESSSESENDE